MSESMIERVRDAIRKSYDTECGELGTTMDERTAAWLARAAIEAMREPAQEMIIAGMDYDEREIELRLGRLPTVEECQTGEWQAMIDAALSEKP